MSESDGPPSRIRAEAGRLGLLTGPWTARFHDRTDGDREAVEAFLETAYDRAFQGRIHRHYPFLASVRGPDGEIAAAVGYRLAGQEPLFLEQYLAGPVEEALSAAWGAPGPIPRDRIAEIGNLASHDAGAWFFLFAALARRLDQIGCTFAAATATRQLRRSFKRIGFETRLLAAAEPGRLGAGAADWGSYYARDPEVRGGFIAQALPMLDWLAPAMPLPAGSRA
jgi:hypothetical protein